MQGGGATALHRKAEIPHDWLKREITMTTFEKRRNKGPIGSAKRRAPQEQQTSPGKEEVLQKSRAEANQNLAKAKEDPRPPRGSYNAKRKVHRAPGLRLCQQRASAAG